MDAGNNRTKNEHARRIELDAQRKSGIRVELDFDDAQWWTREWVQYIENISTPKRISAAKSYARTGKVMELNIQPGLIESKVQGRRKTPYHIRLYSKLPTDEQINEIKHRLCKRAIYGTLLLSGEMPRAIKDIFPSVGAALLPEDYVSSRMLCSCPEPEDICKHILAVLYVSADVLDRNPFLLLKMRGLDKEDLLAALLEPRGLAATVYGKDVRDPQPSVLPSSFMCDVSRPADDTLPLDPSFYGGDGLPQALMDFEARTPASTDIPDPRAPLFDFPLWRGEASFRDSVTPYYESVRKFLKGK